MDHSLIKRVTLFLLLFLFICFALYKIKIKEGVGNKKHVDSSSAGEVSEDNKNLDSELKKTNILLKNGFETADIYYNRGWIYAEKGNYDLAKKDYTYAIELDNSHMDAYFNRGQLYLKEKKYKLSNEDHLLETVLHFSSSADPF